MKMQKREAAKQDGGLFFKLKDGESKIAVLRGEFFEHYVKWFNGKSQEANPNDPESKSRFKVNIVLFESGPPKALIWDMNITTYNSLVSVNEEYPLETTKIKITRHGSGTDTTYSIVALDPRKHALTESSLKQLSEVKLNILNAKAKPIAPPAGEDDFGPPPPDLDEEDDERIPF